MPMVRDLVVLAALIVTLSGCSVAREKARLTFDSHVLVAGRTRSEVEKVFGRPDSVAENSDIVVARYSTGRVDELGKQTLAYSHVGADLFTGGAYELIDPAAVSENENKIIIVSYRGDRIFGDVQVVCASHNREQKYYPGLVCSQVMQG